MTTYNTYEIICDFQDRLVGDWREWKALGDCSNGRNVYHTFSDLFVENSPPTATEFFKYCADNSTTDQMHVFMLETLANDLSKIVFN